MPGARTLILDPIYPDYDCGAHIKALCEKEFDWSITQPKFTDTQTTPEQSLKKFQIDVEEADVFVCLGDFFIFSWLGHLGEKYLDILITRLRSGAPCLLQAPRLRNKFNNGEVPSYVENIFRSCEVMPTEYQVFSETLAFQERMSPMTSWFTKGDRCFLHPKFFTGIDRVLMSSVNLLDYDGDTFPIILPSELHAVTDAGDFRSPNMLSRRNSVAVMRHTDTGLAIIIGGSMLDAPQHTVGGELPGIAPNLTVARRMMQLLDNSIHNKTFFAKEAYGAFFQLERTLGNFIRDVLQMISEDDRIEAYFPEKVRNNITTDGRTDFSLATYNDLTEILLHNWSLFGVSFEGESKNTIKKQFQKLNYVNRRYLAHPHKAEQEGIEFGRENVDQIEAVQKVLKRAFAIHKLSNRYSDIKCRRDEIK